ncbi:MAG TPA: type II toxin-antitoxin system RelE/ParE family toxin, partial [Gemmataceae bacterium]|nr:type II toxin-antitoxin system RelE/ParE family toxin [Gemmataceae bacterium]
PVMSLPLIITPEAEEDIAEAKAWYDRKRLGLGSKFVSRVEEALNRISRFPEIGRVVHLEVRRVLVKQFPYGVFYQIDDNQIGVIAVYHGKRDPRGWQTRI